jgi:hypothetical protein
MMGNPTVAERLAASQQALGPVEFVDSLALMFIYYGYKPFIVTLIPLRIPQRNQRLSCLQPPVRMLLLFRFSL